MQIGLEFRARGVRIARRAMTAALALAAMLVAGAVATQAQTYSVLYSFQCPPDGANPVGGLAADKAGNLYGTTNEGGTGPCDLGPYNGCGTVFKLNTKGGGETVLYSFTGSPKDGAQPHAGVVLDAEGNLYGTTFTGGSNDTGTVFRLTPGGQESVLYAFTDGYDGGYPVGGLVRDSSGNLYGTTPEGGGWGGGVVFALKPSGIETPLHEFYTGQTDGAYPNEGLIQDAAGSFYGTTVSGGVNNAGTIFEITLGGTEKLLHSFLGPPRDGSNPGGSGGKLLRDAAGNLYGAASGGFYNAGVVFKLSPAGTETLLLNFLGGELGTGPQDGLVEDKAGNLYGATVSGGSSTQCVGCGVLFKLAPSGREFVLHSFTGGPTDGSNPNGGLIRDSAGNIYGTTSYGGTSGCGTVFKMTP